MKVKRLLSGSMRRLCADTGRGAVRRKGGLNRGRRCDDM